MNLKITQRIRIRTPVLDDAGFFADIENDADVKKFVGGPSRQFEARYRESIAAMQDDCRCLTIDSIADNKPIGRCGIIIDGAKSEIHLILAKRYWQQNLGSEVAFALVELSSERFPDKILSAKVHPENVASLSILKKLEMAPTGTVDSVGYDNGFLTFEKTQVDLASR